jgi:hypothetical protein
MADVARISRPARQSEIILFNGLSADVDNDRLDAA